MILAIGGIAFALFVFFALLYRGPSGPHYTAIYPLLAALFGGIAFVILLLTIGGRI